MDKSKIALAIGAGSESLIAIRYAKKLGLKVIAFDGDASALGLREADISYIVDISQPKLIISKLNSDGFIPNLILPTLIGRCLISIGALNDYYNLSGFSYDIADICTDKLKFAHALNSPKNWGGKLKYEKFKRD
ncbi:hypothetical protein V2I29_02055 [Campylobacter sp. CX2-8023-23]|uniref:hypothetical protein n=1 Tax=Campylobacter porcelli TaxID=1660073 RepID=UPI002EB61156|nr:hypothetical protein [Campylobacter sp. CX2-8023-23]